jgi:hypothetical protein
MIPRLKYISLAAISAVALCGTPARAQQQPPDPQQQGQQPAAPIPAIHSPLASGADNGDTDNTGAPQQMSPDTTSLTGAQDLTLGTMALSHSYWQPRLSLAGTVDSNPNYSSGSNDWTTWTSFLGGIDIHRTSGVSDLLLSYTGGGMFSNSGTAENGVIQQLALRYRLSYRRSTFSVFEQLGYLPESSFGFAGTAGAGLPGAGSGIGVGTGFTPGQSILTPRGQSLSSSTALEWDYKLAPRTSITFVGSYALLRYFEDNLANFGDASFQAGYNYQLTRKDTIAVSYQFSAFRYSNLDQSINSNTIQGSYGRRVTGRLAFQIAAGPQFVSSTSPITSSTAPTTPTSTSVSAVYWTLNSSLQYQLRRASLGASYNHGVTGGSGLLAGAVTDIVSGSVSEQVTRTFYASWNVGYSRNHGFAVAGTPAAQTYDYWFSGVNVSHPFGRSLDMFLNYQLQYQDTSTGGCVGTGCSATVIRNQIAFGVNVHKQQIPF